MDLKNVLLKLAHEKPEFRKHLVPLIKTAVEKWQVERAKKLFEKKGLGVTRKLIMSSDLAKLIGNAQWLYGGWAVKEDTFNAATAPVIVEESYVWRVPKERFLQFFGVAQVPKELFARRFRRDLFYKTPTHIIEPVILSVSAAERADEFRVYLEFQHRLYDEGHLGEEWYDKAYPRGYER